MKEILRKRSGKELRVAGAGEHLGCRGAPSVLDKRDWEQSGCRDNSIGLAVVGGEWEKYSRVGTPSRLVLFSTYAEVLGTPGCEVSNFTFHLGVCSYMFMCKDEKGKFTLTWYPRI